MTLLWHSTTAQERLDAMRALLGLQTRLHPSKRCAIDPHMQARFVTWLCCRRTVITTHPEKGCQLCHT